MVDKERQLLTQHRPSVGILVTDVSALEPTEGERQSLNQTQVATGQVALVPLVHLQVAQVVTTCIPPCMKPTDITDCTGGQRQVALELLGIGRKNCVGFVLLDLALAAFAT